MVQDNVNAEMGFHLYKIGVQKALFTTYQDISPTEGNMFVCVPKPADHTYEEHGQERKQT